MGESIALLHKLIIDDTAYDLFWLEAHEALDEIGLLRCELSDHEGGPDPAKLLGKTLVLSVSRGDGGDEHTLVGYVTSAERATTRGEEAGGVHVTARPRLFRLTQRSDCRVFQDVSAPDIAKQVLVGAGVPNEAQQWQLTGSYPKRVYTTQYRETDWHFLQRLLSEEGIAFAVDSSSGKDVLVFFDTDLGAIEGDTTLVHRAGDGLDAPRDAIFAIAHNKSTAPGKVNLRDYDFERPRFPLNAKAEGDDEGERTLEVYHHPGRFKEPSLGDRYANVLLDSLRAQREVITGATNTLRLHPGRHFALHEHPYAPLNRSYLVCTVALRLEARRTQARRGDALGHGEGITFTAIPTEKTTYRPPRVPRSVAAAGAQVAMTTGPQGQEIYPDAHGRVKVRFPWDRVGKADETSSLWVRTCQLPLGGSMLTPRIGWEALVNFTDGDPDLPYVFGRMYNGKTPPPYALPANKTRMALQTATTPGGGSSNEIRLEDKAGAEEMFMNASKDASIAAGNNATESVGNNETRAIGANQSLAVTDSMSANIGANQSVTVGGNQTLHVSTFLVDDVGSHTLSVGGNRDLKAGGDHKRSVTGASTLTIGGLQVDLVAGSADEQGLASMKDNVGAALVEMTAANRTVTVSGARTETAGAAKVVVAPGGRSVEVGASLNHKVAGAIITSIQGDRADACKGDYLEVAGGAQIIKADNVIFEASDLLSIVMGGSTLTLTPASLSIAGTKITLDGECDEQAALVTDN